MPNLCPDTGTYSEEHRWNCLARDVCKRPTRDDRLSFLALFGKKNGLKARLKLETIVRDQWALLKEEKNA